MARVQVFQGGNVQARGTTDARFRPADHGPNALAVGLKALGQVGAEAVDKADQIADINARIEANRVLVEHSKIAQEIDDRVKQTLGEGAEGAANQGVTDLDKASGDLLKGVSDRARTLLEPELANRQVIRHDQWTTHGFNEKKTAFESSAIAANAEDLDAASRTGSEVEATPYLQSVVARNQSRGQFFGWSSEQLQAQNRKDVSSYFTAKSRLLATNGANASAAAAIDYATQQRRYMTDSDYQSIISSYHGAAMEERALEEVYGRPLPSSSVNESAPAVADDGTPQPTRHLDPLAFFKSFTIPHEGAAYVTDSNGAGVRYGINQAHNPGVDVKNLSADGAAKVFETKYFKKSGADQLPPALAAVHVDTFFLNEKEAGRILKESGGDVDKYIELRHAFLNGLAAKNPAKYGKYQAGWANRTNELADYAARLGGDGTFPAIPVDAKTNMTGVEQAIMARTDVGLAYKRKLVDAYRERRNGIRTEIEIAQSNAADQLTTAMVQLGDGFTNLTQLPAAVLAQASPQTIQSLTTAAKNNRDRKSNETLIPYADTVEVTDPKKFLSNDFILELKKKGASNELIQSVVKRQSDKRAAILGQKPDPVASGELWTIAKPAFEASGMYLDTLEAKGDGQKAEERKADDAEKVNAISFLRSQAVRWAVENPGKKPTEEEMRKWVGVALIQTQNGKRFYQLTNKELVDSMSATDRAIIADTLRAAGVPPTVGNVADHYRRKKIRRGN